MNKELVDGQFGTGAVPQPVDNRDLLADQILMGNDEFDWEKGYDVEKELDIDIPIKNQGRSGSCVGQGWSYYVGVLNAVETGEYDEASARAIYSQITLGTPSGGAYIREGGKLIVNWGSLFERILTSYENGNPPTEAFMQGKEWITPDMNNLAKVLQAKEYRSIVARTNMELYARAIRDYHGVVSGLNGENNGTWSTNEPKPPVDMKWAHCIYFGKAGIDSLGKYISTPNSWDIRNPDELHPDGWQKIREDYFASGHMFNPWTLMDKPNNQNIMTNVKIGKEENTPEVSIVIPIRSPEAFKSYCANYGIPCPEKENGDVDWEKVNIEVTYKNN